MAYSQFHSQYFDEKAQNPAQIHQRTHLRTPSSPKKLIRRAHHRQLLACQAGAALGKRGSQREQVWGEVNAVNNSTFQQRSKILHGQLYQPFPVQGFVRRGDVSQS